jgi:hypothetical protein
MRQITCKRCGFTTDEDFFPVKYSSHIQEPNFGSSCINEPNVHFVRYVFPSVEQAKAAEEVKKMIKKTPVEELVEQWLSFDKKRNLRDEAHAWLGLKDRPATSTPTHDDEKIVCKEKQKPAKA